VPPNFVLALTPQLRAASSAKVSSGYYTPSSKVISAPLLHFKPIFDFPLKKSCKKAPAFGEGSASKT